ncbi:MAG: multiprotein bridging factor aMBF1 [Candidatus Thorarchaeota archaeon]|nr:multiprotein bridging factor aMBF1 [Candidatus Thorarchaeota archaeon]
MPTCELCGRPMKGRGRTMVIEGATLQVCSTCAARLGADVSTHTKSSRPKAPRTSWTRPVSTPSPPPRKPLARPISSRSRPRSSPRRSGPATLDELILIEDYAVVIRRARQKAGLTQEQLAQRIGEKFSTLQGIETGRLKPTKKTIRGLERELKISLLEPVGPVPIKTSADIGAHGPTLGDVVKVKRKKHKS